MGLLLLLAAPAVAARPYDEHVADPAATCPAAPETPGMVQVMGRARAFSQQVAMDLAREDAVQTMLSMHAAGFGDAAREAVRRNTVEVEGAGTWLRGVACVPMALRSSYLDYYVDKGKEFDSQIHALVAALSRDAVGRSVLVLPPTQVGSGAVSQLSDTIRNLLLGQIDPNDNIHIVDNWVPDALELQIQLSTVKEDVTGFVTLGEQSIGGLQFPLGLFNLTPGEANRGIPPGNLSGGGEPRRGTNGLKVYMAPPTPNGIACEGQVVDLVANTDRNARVRLYSVASDGRTYLLWPPDPRWVGVPAGLGPTADEVPRQLRLPGTTMVPTADGQAERLILVAVPAGGSLGAAERWRGYCEVRGGFSEALVPAGAAVSSTSFLVRPAEATGCVLSEAIEQDRLASAQAIVDQAMPCE